jgi:predicted ester cyclase
MSATRLIHGSTAGGAESELVEYAKNPTTPRSKSQDNKAIVDRWFTEFWGKSWNPRIVDGLGAPDILLQYLLQKPHRGRASVKMFMTEFREAFPDLSVTGAADFVCEGDYVVGRWEGGGTHTGPSYCDFLVGCLPAGSGQKMRFTGTTVLRVENGKIAEQIGLDDGVTALLQLGLTGAA